MENTELEDLMFCPSTPDKCKGCEVNTKHVFYLKLISKGFEKLVAENICVMVFQAFVMEAA